jgi:DNA-binding GntR family transcriptional regulator
MTKDIETIYEKILNDIITLNIKPGARLKEAEVSRQFNVSRTPIRDVFKKLENDKLLVIYSQSGTYVTKIDLNGITDLMYLRCVVEYSVLSDLTSFITPGDIIQLRIFIKDQKSLLKADGQGGDEEFASNFFRLDNEFHHQIFRKAGKESVLDLLNNSYPYFSRYRFLTFFRDETEITNLFDVHSKIVDCLETKDKTSLKSVITEHNFSGLNGIEKVRERHPDYFN